MTRPRRDSANTDGSIRSHAGCYLALGMVGSLAAALLGLIYEQHAVWAASLAVFALLCLQGACGYYWGRERPVVAIQIAITSAPLRASTL
jgi:cyanate permease